MATIFPPKIDTILLGDANSECIQKQKAICIQLLLKPALDSQLSICLQNPQPGRSFFFFFKEKLSSGEHSRHGLRACLPSPHLCNTTFKIAFSLEHLLVIFLKLHGMKYTNNTSYQFLVLLYMRGHGYRFNCPRPIVPTLTLTL